MSCLGEFAVPFRASNAVTGAGRGGRLEGGDITRGRLGNAAGGSLPALQPLHLALGVRPSPFPSRVAPHGQRPLWWVCPGQSPLASFRRIRHAFSGTTRSWGAASAAPDCIRFSAPVSQGVPRVSLHEGVTTGTKCDFPDVGSHLVAKEQRAVPIWVILVRARHHHKIRQIFT